MRFKRKSPRCRAIASLPEPLRSQAQAHYERLLQRHADRAHMPWVRAVLTLAAIQIVNGHLQRQSYKGSPAKRRKRLRRAIEKMKLAGIPWRRKDRKAGQPGNLIDFTPTQHEIQGEAWRQRRREYWAKRNAAEAADRESSATAKRVLESPRSINIGS
ncbi:MAG TPA: hypothetical protein VFL79_19645 [Terriglobia bacterium]|nr:hypothetical protein [Terriglobia bacterium]